MTYNKRKIGTEYERKAGEYLEKNGYRVLAYNYRTRRGEIDIVARDGEYLVFCEVKYRKGAGSGHPSEAVDYKKQRILSRCALYYVMKEKVRDVPCRFDVVSILDQEITLIKNAFDYTG